MIIRRQNRRDAGAELFQSRNDLKNQGEHERCKTPRRQAWKKREEKNSFFAFLLFIPCRLGALAFIHSILLSTAFAGRPQHVESPDGNVAIDFRLQADGASAYSIQYLGHPIVLESRLGLEPDLLAGFQQANASTSAHRDQWTYAFGERKNIPDNYNLLTIDLKQSSGKLLRIEFRAYNEGAAFRYSLPQQPGGPFTFTGERSEFRFPENTFGYEEHGTEGEYRRAAIADIQPWCERPLTLEYADGIFASLTEADNERYPRMLLSPLQGVPGALVSAAGRPEFQQPDRPARGQPRHAFAG